MTPSDGRLAPFGWQAEMGWLEFGRARGTVEFVAEEMSVVARSQPNRGQSALGGHVDLNAEMGFPGCG